jgi:hypothetical protein
MSLCTKFLNTGLRLTSVTLAATLIGCSSSPSSNDSDSQNTVSAASTTQSRSAIPPSDSAQKAYEPTLERINEPVPLAEGHPNEYVVQVGDTLWDISAAFLRDPWFWPEIWYVNPDIENPHLIYPGDVLGLVYIDGRPRVTNVRASTFRLSPQARATPLSQAVLSIPYEKVAAFLKAGIILERSQADDMPYLLQTRGDHLIASAGNEVYVRGVEDDQPRTMYTVINVGEKLRDPDNNDVIGYHGKMIGEAILRRSGDPATIALINTSQEVNMGDRLLPEVVDVPLNFFPRAPGTEVDGRIIAVAGGVTQIGQYQVVVMNRGSSHGLTVGDVLSVFQSGEEINDRFGGGKVRLPDEDEGTVMIFKTYNRISYGLIMEARNAIHILDAVRNPT